MEALVFIYVCLIGALVGSFLNVVIYRLPRGESVVTPRSACPACGEPVRWFDNLPLASWVLLGARCRFCEAPISVRYPIVELANAVLWGAAYAWLGASLSALTLAVVFSLLIGLIFIDLDTQFLPDVLNYPALALALVLPLLHSGENRDLFLSRSLSEALIGAIAGAGAIALVSFSYYLLRREEGMGRGDIKLMAVVGALAGWKAILPVIFLASFFGAAVGLTLGARQKKGMQVALPFGPFIGIALLATVFFGRDLLRWVSV